MYAHPVGRFVRLLCVYHAVQGHTYLLWYGIVCSIVPRFITYSLIYYLVDTYMQYFGKWYSYFSVPTTPVEIIFLAP